MCSPEMVNELLTKWRGRTCTDRAFLLTMLQYKGLILQFKLRE
nr:MAG TPA: hypothetical protein [Caudoviricetes sp.]